MDTLRKSLLSLELSITAAKHTALHANAPLQRRLTWLACELERLASEAYSLADEAGDDTEENPCPKK